MGLGSSTAPFPEAPRERDAAQAGYLDGNMSFKKQRLIRGRGDDTTLKN